MASSERQRPRVHSSASYPPPADWVVPVVSLDITNLPLLPNIIDSALRRRVFLHKSALELPAAPETAEHIRNQYRNEVQSNRRLEFVGDGVWQGLVANALFELFPDASSHCLTVRTFPLRRCSWGTDQVRIQQLANPLYTNVTLSYFAWGYHLPDRFETKDAVVRTEQNAAADVFEAYVAGLLRDGADADGRLRDWVRQVVSTRVLPSLHMDADRHVEETLAKQEKSRVNKLKRQREVGDVGKRGESAQPVATQTRSRD